MMRVHVLFAGIVLLLGTVVMAEDVGTVAATRGTADIGRGGARTPAAVGQTIELGDQLRTGSDGQLRVVFRDDSVIDLAENSSLVVDQQVFDPAASSFTSLMRLVSGKARAFVSEYYRTPGAAYQVQTPTAVAGVRGTSFLVAYDPAHDNTDVIGIHGQIEVRSLNERGDVVYVNAHETTTVWRGEPPTPPETMDDQHFHREIEGLEQMSMGSLGSLAAGHAVSGGGRVPAPDRAPPASSVAGQLGRDQLRNTGDVVGQPPSVVGATRGSLGVPF
jgi:hypothetical protein